MCCLVVYPNYRIIALPDAGWTFWAGTGSISSAGPFWWSLCWMPHFHSWEIVDSKDLEVSTVVESFFFFFFEDLAFPICVKKKKKILHGQHKVWKKSVLLNSLEMGLFHVYVLELKFFCRWASWGRICSWSPDRREILISIACSLGHQHRHPSETVQYLIKWLLLYTFVHLRTQFPATAFIQHPN